MSASTAPKADAPAALSQAEINTLRPRSGAGRTIGMVIGALLLLGVVAAVAFVLLPQKGTLVVTVAGPGNKALDAVQISVDGNKKCEASPCRVQDLPAGTHMVKATAPGYAGTADTAVKVKARDEEVLNLTLAAASLGTGIRVSAEGTGLKLFVDGQEAGPLPAEVKDLTPGDHTIKIAGNDRYEAFEKRVTVEADKLLDLGSIKLKVLKGLANIQPGANSENAKVVLVSGSERRPIPSLPIKIDISADKSYTLEATRKGYQDYREPIRFDDGQAERTFTVNLTSEAEAASAGSTVASNATTNNGGKTASATTGAGHPPAFLAGAADAKPASAAPAAATGSGKLNINSIPVSKVLLDGAPQGQTPRIGVSVSPGVHTVVFIHPEKGRKVQSVTVKAGETATAVVRF